MGLILCCAMLVALYCIKIFYPNVVVGVAEITPIVKFGNFIDAHKWVYYPINGILSFVILYFYSCACCRIRKLTFFEDIVVCLFVVLSHIIEEFAVEHLVGYNFILYLLIPLFIVKKRKIINPNVFNSTAICFIITTMAQSLSLAIRDIPLYISAHNTATYFVLLIDVYIWNFLLYNYYNFKGVQ